MSRTVRIDPARFFEFIGRPGAAVVFISVHPRHALNRALLDYLPEAQGEPVAFGAVSLRQLVVAALPAIRFLHGELSACGAPSSFGILPGYYLFREGRLLVWDSGLPAGVDLASIARSALLGAIWSGVTGRLTFVREAVYFAAQEATAERVAGLFRQAILDDVADVTGARSRARASSPEEELRRAYQTLGVEPTATEQEVRNAWRKRRMESHPDRAANDPVEFERLNRISVEMNRARDVILGHTARSHRWPSA